MYQQTAVVGDTQEITIDFQDAKPDDVYIVTVQIQKPNGVIEKSTIEYKFVDPLERKNDG